MKLLLSVACVSLSVFHVAHALNKFGGNVPVEGAFTADIKADLGPKLSPGADVTVSGEELHEELIIKYSDFNRPTFSAVVAVASIQDVVETACHSHQEAGEIELTRADLAGQICKGERYTFSDAIWRPQSYDIDAGSAERYPNQHASPELRELRQKGHNRDSRRRHPYRGVY